MLALRISLAIYGILLAIFLQAYGLPIFLATTLLLGWWIENVSLNNDIQKNSGSGSNWIVYFTGLVILLFGVAAIFESQVSNFLTIWDEISILSVHSLQLPYEPMTQRHAAAKLALNLSALVTPILVARWLIYLTSPFLGLKKTAERAALLFVIFVPFVFSVWGMSHIRSNVFHTEFLLYLCFFIPCLALIVLFREIQ